MTTAPITVLKQEYVTLLEVLLPDLSRATRFCAAKLIQVFRRLLEWKQQTYAIERPEDCWVWIPIKVQDETKANKSGLRSLWDELQGEHCKDIIRRALQALQDCKVLLRRENPFNGQNRILEYQLNLTRLDELLKSPSQSEVSPPEDEGSTPGDDRSPPITDHRSAPSLETTNAPEAAAVEGEKGTAEEVDQHPPSSSPSPVNPPAQAAQPSVKDLSSAPALRMRLKAVQIEWNRTVRAELERWRDRAEDALEYVRLERQRWAVSNPTGLFIAALREGRKPAIVSSLPPPPAEQRKEVDLLSPDTYHHHLQAVSQLYASKGLESLLGRLNYWISSGERRLVEYLIRESEWGYEVEINGDGFVETAF